MAQGWGKDTWGLGRYGELSNVYLDVSSQATLSTNLGSLTITTEINAGWSRSTWGSDAWGIAGDVLLTGQALTTDIASLSLSCTGMSGANVFVSIP